MKKLIFTIILISTVVLAGCNTETALTTDQEKAQKYGLTLQEYQEQKEAAARMGMNVDDHLKALE